MLDAEEDAKRMKYVARKEMTARTCDELWDAEWQRPRLGLGWASGKVTVRRWRFT